MRAGLKLPAQPTREHAVIGSNLKSCRRTYAIWPMLRFNYSAKIRVIHPYGCITCRTLTPENIERGVGRFRSQCNIEPSMSLMAIQMFGTGSAVITTMRISQGVSSPWEVEVKS